LNYLLIIYLTNVAIYSYVVDTLLAKNGHAVLRDPPYHCEYNPIELIWSITKRIYTKLIRQIKSSVSVNQAVQTWEQALSCVDPTAWANAAAHCDKLVMDHYAAEFGNNPPTNNIQRIVATLDSSDSDMSDAEYEKHVSRRLDYENQQAEKKRKDEERREKLLKEVKFYSTSFFWCLYFFYSIIAAFGEKQKSGN
jgi:hypothetical protein